MAWLTGWNYRKAITISNTGSALSDYQVSITIDTMALILAGKMRSDCGDIRFTDDDGSTHLNYWIESGQNTISTKIWIKIPSVPIIKIIYIYYNNPSATSESNGLNTFAFFEDFESYTTGATINGINGWTVLDGYGGGSLTTVQTDYAVSPGTKSLRIGATSSGNQRNDAIKTLPLKITDDIIVELDFRTTKPAVNSGGGDTIQWNYSGSGTIIDDTKLAVGIALGRGWVGQGNYFIWHQPDGTAMTTFAESTWYKLRMDVLFSTKKSSHYINGVKYTTDVNFYDVTATGITKFSSWRYSWGNAYYTWVDNIRIRKYASPEPTIPSIGSEQAYIPTVCVAPVCNFIVT